MEGAPSLRMKLLKFLRSLVKLRPPTESKPSIIQQFGLESIAQPGPDTAIMEDHLQKLRPYFADDAFGHIARAYVYPSGPGPRTMPTAVAGLLSQQFVDPTLTEPPQSTSHFLSRMSSIFSQSFIVYLEAKIHAFDKVCGEPVSDVFFAVRTLEHWATELVENTIEALMAPAWAAVRENDAARITQYDGAATPPPLAPTARELPILQINLRGRSLKEAWVSNDAIQQLTAYEQDVRPRWTPSTPGGLPVFHGTLGRPADDYTDMEDALATMPTTLERREGNTQLLPRSGKNMRGVYTSYSALRSFLFTAFHSEVISDPPGPTPLIRISKPIPMRGQTYYGTLLLVIRAAQPAPAGLTSYEIPAGREEEWMDKVKRHPQWYGDIKSIHGQEGVREFPDLVQGRDLSRLRQALQPFPCNGALLWQTAWASQAAEDALNRAVTEGFAISFDLEGPEEPDAPKDGEKPGQPRPDEEPKPKKGFRGFVKKVGSKVKGVFKKNDA